MLWSDGGEVASLVHVDPLRPKATPPERAAFVRGIALACRLEPTFLVELLRDHSDSWQIAETIDNAVQAAEAYHLNRVLTAQANRRAGSKKKSGRT